MDQFEDLKAAVQKGVIPKELGATLYNFFLSFEEAAFENQYTREQIAPLLDTYLNLVIDEWKSPYNFEPYHEHITTPFNYYKFGLDLVRPLVIFDKSTLSGSTNLRAIESAIAQKENVILLANHQTEPDPQAISLLLEQEHPQLAEKMIFVAGHRVTTDPLAIPLSKGRNLLCIYSKRHVEHDPETKADKMMHNQRTMKQMGQLLSEGGCCIYVAPSGGRDRPDTDGTLEVAKFNPQSLEMFWLMAQQAGKKTHFHPLALYTYQLLPPPSSIEKELGERRHAHATPIHLHFGHAIDMLDYTGCDEPDKRKRRENRAEHIWQLVADAYKQFPL